MVWSRIDDGFLDHPKVLRAGEDAANLYIRALVWANKHLTDGNVPSEALRAITSKPGAVKLAARLVEAGLWEAQDGGWYIHNFAELNPSRADVEARRAELSAKRAESGRKGGLQRSAAKQLASKDEANHKQVASNDEANAKQLASTGAKQNEAHNHNHNQNHNPAPLCPSDTGGAGGLAPPDPPPTVVPTSGERSVATEAKPSKASKKPPNAPAVDPVPEPGTLARRVFDAITQSCLASIVAGPGAASVAFAHPDAYPGVDVLAEVLRAAEYASSRPGAYTDGRAFLRNWLTRRAEEAAQRPKPAAGHVPPSVPSAGTGGASPRDGGPVSEEEGRVHRFRALVGTRATLTGSVQVESEFAAQLAGAMLTTAEAEAVAQALTTPTAWWPQGRTAPPGHVTLADLAGWKSPDGRSYEWRPWASLLSHVRAKRRPPATPPEPPRTVMAPAALAAGLRTVRSKLLATAPAVTPDAEATRAS